MHVKGGTSGKEMVESGIWRYLQERKSNNPVRKITFQDRKSSNLGLKMTSLPVKSLGFTAPSSLFYLYRDKPLLYLL